MNSKAFWIHAAKPKLCFQQPQVTRTVTNELERKVIISYAPLPKACMVRTSLTVPWRRRCLLISMVRTAHFSSISRLGSDWGRSYSGLSRFESRSEKEAGHVRSCFAIHQQRGGGTSLKLSMLHFMGKMGRGGGRVVRHMSFLPCLMFNEPSFLIQRLMKCRLMRV